MSSRLTYTPKDTGTEHSEFIPTTDSFYSGVADLIIQDKQVILDITEGTQIEQGLHMGKLMLDEQLILLIAQQSPTLNNWLLHVLTNNENISGGFYGVFKKLGKIDDSFDEISFDAKNIPAISNLNIGNNDGNSFLTLNTY